MLKDAQHPGPSRTVSAWCFGVMEEAGKTALSTLYRHVDEGEGPISALPSFRKAVTWRLPQSMKSLGVHPEIGSEEGQSLAGPVPQCGEGRF